MVQIESSYRDSSRKLGTIYPKEGRESQEKRVFSGKDSFESSKAVQKKMLLLTNPGPPKRDYFPTSTLEALAEALADCDDPYGY